MSEPKRSQRVGQLLQQELGKILVDDLNDPRIGFVTVTEVRLSNDLRTARIYVSVYGSQEQRQETLSRLDAAAGFLKRELGHRLSLKYTPELTFWYDDSLDKAERLDEIIGAISAGETEIPEESTHDPVIPIQTTRSELADRARTFSEKETPKRKTKPRGRRGRRR